MTYVVAHRSDKLTPRGEEVVAELVDCAARPPASRAVFAFPQNAARAAF